MSLVFINKEPFEQIETHTFSLDKLKCIYCEITLRSIKYITDQKCLTYEERIIKNILE